jgi:hypothetical protein
MEGQRQRRTSLQNVWVLVLAVHLAVFGTCDSVTNASLVDLGTIFVLAGNRSAGSAQGAFQAARFDRPLDLLISPVSDSIAYLSDHGNHAIIRVDLREKNVTRWLGTGVPGAIDGVGTQAQLSYPWALCLHPRSPGDLLIGDDTSIRSVDLSTARTTSVLGGDTTGYAEGTGPTALFHGVRAIVPRPSDLNLLVSDMLNHRIRLVDSARFISSPYAGSGRGSTRDGVGIAAYLDFPAGLIVMAPSNELIFAQNYVPCLRRIAMDPLNVTTLAGVCDATAGEGYRDGPLATARFSRQYKLLYAKMRRFYVSDLNNHVVRRIDMAAGTVITVIGAGVAGAPAGFVASTAAPIDTPFAMTYGCSGGFLKLYVSCGHFLLQVNLTDQADDGGSCLPTAIDIGPLDVIAGSAGEPSSGLVSGVGPDARFQRPSGLAVDPRDPSVMYVADQDNHCIRRINTTMRLVTTCLGSNSPLTYSLTEPTMIRFNPHNPDQLVIADYYKIHSFLVSTANFGLVSGGGTAGYVEGSQPLYRHVYDFAFDSSDADDLYVADLNNNRVRVVSMSGGYSKLLAGSGASLSADGVGASASFGTPTGLALRRLTYWLLIT